jgi:hypothetical protein
MLLFALAPCGRVLSLDAVLRRLLGRRANDDHTRRERPRTSRFARWPFELLLIELAFYYFAAGLTKVVTSGPAWADGSTLQYHLVERGMPLGLVIAPHLWLCALLSAGALAFEMLFPVAIFVRRLRPWLLAAGVAFHVGNHFLLNLIFWPVIAVYPLVVPWSVLRRGVGRLLQCDPARRYAVRTRGLET